MNTGSCKHQRGTRYDLLATKISRMDTTYEKLGHVNFKHQLVFKKIDYRRQLRLRHPMKKNITWTEMHIFRIYLIVHLITICFLHHQVSL